MSEISCLVSGEWPKISLMPEPLPLALLPHAVAMCFPPLCMLYLSSHFPDFWIPTVGQPHARVWVHWEEDPSYKKFILGDNMMHLWTQKIYNALREVPRRPPGERWDGHVLGCGRQQKTYHQEASGRRQHLSQVRKIRLLPGKEGREKTTS